jgi:hypothetical protein
MHCNPTITCDDGHLALQLAAALVGVAYEDWLAAHVSLHTRLVRLQKTKQQQQQQQQCM